MTMYINTHTPIEAGKILMRNGKPVRVLDNTVTSTGGYTSTDITDMSEALAMNIITLVREAA